MKKLIMALVLLASLLFAGHASAQTVDDVKARLDFLKDNTRWIQSYKVDTFDCSNMATVLSRMVFCDMETRIVQGEMVSGFKLAVLPDKIILVPEYALHALVKVRAMDGWLWIDPVELTVSDMAPDFNPDGMVLEFRDYREAMARHVYGRMEYGVDIDYLLDKVMMPK